MDAPTDGTLPGSNDMDMLKALSGLKYEAQAVWFLNGYWEPFAEDEREQIRTYTYGMIELDEKSGKDGCELDELTSHRFLERFGETLTVLELRKALKEIDIDTNKCMSLSEFLIHQYGPKGVDWHELIKKPQGANAEEIAKAEAMMAEAQEKLETAQTRAQESRAAAEAARQAATEAAQRLQESETAQAEAEKAAAEAATAADAARSAEAEAQKAEDELRAALADLKAQEDAYNARLAELQAKTETGGLVSRNKAKNELAQAKQEDPLPLQRAKITQEAAVRKSEKATAEAQAARSSAEAAEKASAEAAADAKAAKEAAAAAKQAADAADAEAAAAKEAADQSLEEAKAFFSEAEAFLAEAKSKVGDAQGKIWWMERELEEKRKYLPTAKGGIATKATGAKKW